MQYWTIPETCTSPERDVCWAGVDEYKRKDGLRFFVDQGYLIGKKLGTKDV
jgi:hypothetical protein